MVAEHKLRNELAEQLRTTSSSSAGRHTAELGMKLDNYSLPASPIVGLEWEKYYGHNVYQDQWHLHVISKQQYSEIKSDNIRQSDSTAGSSTIFKNWASEVKIYMSLEDHNLIDIMENVKQTTPIYDDSFIDHEQQ
eukprot:1885031-Amphidinium_carterae.1